MKAGLVMRVYEVARCGIVSSLLLVACASDSDPAGSSSRTTSATTSSSGSGGAAGASSTGGAGGAGGGGGSGGSGASGLTCEEACLDKHPDGLDLYAPASLCLACDQCYDQCGGAANDNCSGPPATVSDCDASQTTCEACLKCTQVLGGACSDPIAACSADPECKALSDCLNACVNGG